MILRRTRLRIVICVFLLTPILASPFELNNIVIQGAINGECRAVTGDGNIILMGAGINLNCFLFAEDSLIKYSQLSLPYRS